MLETACNKSTVFGADSVMVLAGIHHGGRTALVHVGGALTVIRHRDVIPVMDVNCGLFQHDNVRPDVARVRSFCSTKTFRHYIGLSVRRI